MGKRGKKVAWDLEDICARIENGQTMKQISAAYDTEATSVRRWLRSDPERKERWTEAKAASADTLVEDAQTLLDEASPETAAEASIIRERAGFRRWLAGKRDRDQYGDGPSVAVQLDIQQLHLAALQQSGHMDAVRGREVEADYEIVAPEAPKEIAKESWDRAQKKVEKIGDLPPRRPNG